MFAVGLDLRVELRREMRQFYYVSWSAVVGVVLLRGCQKSAAELVQVYLLFG
ncbi:hypothetical protein SynRS9907_00821 [Synechococcus sp. RS9907]|nr:hypothetical protein SynRS9907_00821 [Synechococcus sp. RS9907]